MDFWRLHCIYLLARNPFRKVSNISNHLLSVSSGNASSDSGGEASYSRRKLGEWRFYRRDISPQQSQRQSNLHASLAVWDLIDRIDGAHVDATRIYG